MWFLCFLFYSNCFKDNNFTAVSSVKVYIGMYEGEQYLYHIIGEYGKPQQYPYPA